ncbi:ABC transporter substrate-binding protein [Mycetocola sp. JXN-3]|uniref:ABC transporter substrate-binding protein n=1 Tax=Mycetocola sp. JXN-3 TaxID=2116510 RepID=UPI00165D2E7F|nr:ABC transporter substrate-binding protein [Mycetocola sp. JXN-3]
MKRSTRLTLIAGAVAVVLAGSAGIVWAVNANHGSEDAAVAATVPVALKVSGVPQDAPIGVIVTLGANPVGGAEWQTAAQGAAVAERRLQLGGTKIKLITVNDKGTTEGARDAVAQLAKDSVAGIVFASAGVHTRAGVDAARSAGIPTLLPYSSDPITTVGLTWRTGPDNAEFVNAINAAAGKAKRPLLISAEGSPLNKVSHVDNIYIAPDTDTTVLAADIALRAGMAPTVVAEGEPTPAPVENPADAVIINAPPAQQAQIVRAIQAANISLPLVLSPGATSPAFPAALRTADGTVTGRLLTVGANTGDAVALDRGAAGRSMSAFLAGVRVLAADGSAQNLTGDQPFSAVAAAADSRSHDAVIALVRAIEKAGSVEPAKVAEALRTLKLGAAEGIAGPTLDFEKPAAFTGSVTGLHASTDDLGLRPSVDGAVATVWYPLTSH